MSNVIEIEVNSAGRNLFFEPIDRVVRGELDFSRIKEPQARLMTDRYPLPIPGQRIRLDAKAGVGAIIDPLWEPEHTATAEQLKKRFSLPPEEELFPNVHVATWLDRMQRAVKDGHAKLVAGEFPEKLPGKPIMRMLTGEIESPADKQAMILDKLAAAVDKLADKLGNWE